MGTTEDRPLPAAIRRALDEVVNGPGRRATAAHPDCRCGKSWLPGCRACGAPADQPCREITVGDVTPPTPCPSRSPQRWTTAKDCPQHRPEPSR